MFVESLSIPEVLRIRPLRFGDSRGYFSEIFSASAFRDHVVGVDFVQDNEASSKAAGTLRGLHFQRAPRAQGKLIRVIKGAIFDVAVDIRLGSPTYGRHVSARLDGVLGDQLWVPAGFAHGYCTLEPDTIVAYKVTYSYSPADEGGVIWNDPAIGIDWPDLGYSPVLSDKDLKLPCLANLRPAFVYDNEQEVVA